MARYEVKENAWNVFLPLSHLELCWSVLTAFLLVKLRKMAASVPMKSMYIPEKSSSSVRQETATDVFVFLKGFLKFRKSEFNIRSWYILQCVCILFISFHVCRAKYWKTFAPVSLLSVWLLKQKHTGTLKCWWKMQLNHTLVLLKNVWVSCRIRGLPKEHESIPYEKLYAFQIMLANYTKILTSFSHKHS